MSYGSETGHTLTALYSVRPDRSRHPESIPVYSRFKQHLADLGFTVYPEEFDCINSEHPLVDIAARMGFQYWAFEYKSKSDSISRGVEQVECYQKWFDQVVLVSERILNHRTSENYWRLRRMGVGIWIYDPATDKCIIKSQPNSWRAEPFQRKLVSRRFNSLTSIRRGRKCSFSNSSSICDLRSFVSR